MLAPPPLPPAASRSAAPPAGASGAGPVPPESRPPLELELTANQETVEGEQRRFVASGNVMARIAGGRVMADRLEYDAENRSIHAYGRVRFQRGQQYLQASWLRYSLLEGVGEIEDVYGVLDLDGSAQDFDFLATPSAPLPKAEEMACTPPIPLPPQWHPYPWAVTAWGGQMVAANFGDTFIFRGRMRPEGLGGIGLQRRLLDAGPLAFEIDSNLMLHAAERQPGGPFNQEVPNASTPAQTFVEGTLGIGLRVWVQPWLSFYFVEGVSLLSQNSNYERTFRENYTTFLNYLAFEVEALVRPQWSLVGRIHHRSGAYGTYSGVSEGSNGYLVGLRYRFGNSGKVRPVLEVPPAQGCPGAPVPGQEGPRGLGEQLQAVTMGPPPAPSSAASSSSVAVPPAANPPRGDLWSRARAQERARAAAIARVDQRVSDLTYQQSLIAERRAGYPTQFTTPDTVNEFGIVRPPQLQDLTTKSNRQLVRGTVSRWRFQARRLRFTPTTFSGDRIGFTNDPFTPAQSWLDSEDVVGTLMPSGDTVIHARRNRLRLDDRLPVAVSRQTTIRKQEEVNNRWVLATDQLDRDGFYVGRDIPFRIGRQGLFTIQPQLLIQRAINGSTDSYPYPWRSAGDDPKRQPATTGDLFGLAAELNTPLAGFEVRANLSISSFDPANFSNATRSWGDISRSFSLPLLGPTTWKTFGAYRFRTWNGSLGEQTIYSAYGMSLEGRGVLPDLGSLSSSYFWRLGGGNFQDDVFKTTNLADLWRGNAIVAINSTLPLWRGRSAPLTATGAYANSPVPIIPGLSLNTNLIGTMAFYSDGRSQQTVTLSGGPTLTLGHFVRPFLDFTQLTITGGGTLRQGASPLSFDRAVDLGTLGVGLTQQIAGPLVFSGGIGFNVDPASSFYGDVTGSYIELRWQRRAYEIGVFYSPYEGLGGVRVKINDFNFSGPGTPFIPFEPSRAALGRPF